MTRVKLTVLPFIFWLLQTPGKWQKKTSHSHVFFLRLGQCGRFLLASLVAAILLRVCCLADTVLQTALSQFETCLTWFFSFDASLLILVPLVFLKWDTTTWWCSVLTASQMLLFGNCSMAAFAFWSHFGLRAKVWWTWDFWCLSTPDFCMLSTPSMIAWLHKIRSIFAC